MWGGRGVVEREIGGSELGSRKGQGGRGEGEGGGGGGWEIWKLLSLAVD